MRSCTHKIDHQEKHFECRSTESLVYVHYNFRLLSHYCDATKNDRAYLTCDKNPEEANLEDGSIELEHLEAELLGDHDGDQIHTT
jgi:hypothetical protein